VIEGFQLSPQQRDVWRHQRGGEWHVCWAVLRVNRRGEPAQLRRAVEQLLGRYEILRTRFCDLPGLAYPLQTIGDASLEWTERSVACALDVEVRDEVERLRQALEAGGPHVRASFLVEDGAAHLFLGGPALYWDERSLVMLAQQLGRPDEGDGSGEAIQYIDYAQWHSDLLADVEAPDRRAGVAFWTDTRLEQIPAAPFESTRAAAVAHGRVTDSCAGAGAMRALAKATGVAPGAVVSAAWGIVLARLYGAAELRLGYQFDGRRQRELAKCIGPLDCCLPVRVAPDLSRSFADEVRTVGETLAAAANAQDWVWAADAVTAHRSSVGVACVIADTGPGDADRVVDVGSTRRAVLDLRCLVDGERLGLALEFDPQHVVPSEARLLLGSVRTLLANALAAPEVRAGEIALVAPAEALPIVARPATAAGRPSATGCLHERFEARARMDGDALAVAYGPDHLTFRELDERSNRLARALRNLGVGREAPVVLCVSRSVAAVEGVLGILKAGGAFLPIDIDDPEARALKIAASGGARVVLTEPDKRAGFEGAGFTVLTPSGPAGWVGDDVSAAPLANVNAPHDLAYVLYTSGSTGEPKGVQIEHRSALNLLAGLKRAIYAEQLGDDGLRGARASMNAPFSFDASIKQFVLLLEGCSLHLVPAALRPDGAALLGFLQDERIDILDCTPSQLKLLLGVGLLKSAHRFPGLALVGGEPIDAELWTALAAQDRHAFYNVYGPTECTVDTTVGRVTADTQPHIGRPIDNVYVRLLDPALSAVPRGFVGEICIGGAGVARGYLGRSDLTSKAFVAWTPPVPGAESERLYRSGDLGRLREDGELEFIGRRDEQVKIRGVRIEPEEIAAVARSHPEVSDAVVIARPSDQLLICYVVPTDARRTGSASTASVRRHLRERLPQAMVPTHVIFVDAFPTTANGKLDKSRLPSTEGLRPELVSYQAPESEIEGEIVDIWQGILHLEQVGVLDNFFDVGGHSLLLPEVQLEIQRRLELTISLPQLIEFPTPQAIARHFDASSTAAVGEDDRDRGAKQREARTLLARRGRSS